VLLSRSLCLQLKRLQIDSRCAVTIDELVSFPDRPDLLIIDFNLCGMTAIDCALPLEERWPDVPRIVLSASFLSDEDLAQVTALRYRLVLQKPLRSGQIQNLIATYCTPEER
jgi:CheY-like chemotaxis protein